MANPVPDNPPDTPLPQRIAAWLCWAVALLFFTGLWHYYVTGGRGPTLLAVAMVPAAVALVYLNDARRGELYPLLGAWGGLIAATIYAGIAGAAGLYLVVQFEALRIERVGIFTATDLAAGGAIIALILEYTRRKYLPVFLVNVALVLYAVFGQHVPGLFRHGGVSWQGVVGAASLDMSTGAFDRLAQLGLTLIGSFILVLAAMQAFDVIGSILKGSGRLATRSPRLLPQAAVVGSFGVAAVSGSGAANAATTGSATIPALIRAGFPPVRAAAVETASSIGGQLMPPLMGIAAFMMADFLGVSYFDVVARGFAPAIIYFLGVSLAVYLLAARFQKRLEAPDTPPLAAMDWVNLAAYLAALAALIWLMGIERWPAETAAQRVFVVLIIGLGALFLLDRWRRRDWAWRQLVRPFGRTIHGFALTTSELTILLATLGVLTAMFDITGVPTRVGILVMDLAQVHLVLMVLVAFAFGYIVGMGLPVAPTYIIVAVVIGPHMIRAGIDPWVVHFFAFFVAVFGELSPPTSVTAAVTSRIAGSPFVATMMAALTLCVPLLLMTAAVFTRPQLVVEVGGAQLGAFVIVGLGTAATIVALQARLHPRRGIDITLRLGLALLAVAALLHPDATVAAIFAGCIAIALLAAMASARARPVPPRMHTDAQG